MGRWGCPRRVGRLSTFEGKVEDVESPKTCTKIGRSPTSLQHLGEFRNLMRNLESTKCLFFLSTGHTIHIMGLSPNAEPHPWHLIVMLQTCSTWCTDQKSSQLLTPLEYWSFTKWMDQSREFPKPPKTMVISILIWSSLGWFEGIPIVGNVKFCHHLKTTEKLCLCLCSLQFIECLVETKILQQNQKSIS